MGVALYLVWQSAASKSMKRAATALFLIHLAVNAMWSIVFFGLHSVGGAFIVILILLLMILWVMLTFRRITQWAAYLLVPYFLWVLFATFLNGALLFLN